MVAAVLTGLVAALALLAILLPSGRLAPLVRLLAVGLLVLLAAAATSTALGSELTGRGHAVVVILAMVAAAAGGNVVTTAAFEIIDAGDHYPDPAGSADPAGPAGFADATDGSLRSAGQILRGGMWIGVLERLAVFATLVARWPEGIAVVLAVKGLGRYPELRTGRRPGLAERFIIGTLVSVLWAGLCAYAATGPALG
jgi:hypothetical protein